MCLTTIGQRREPEILRRRGDVDKDQVSYAILFLARRSSAEFFINVSHRPVRPAATMEASKSSFGLVSSTLLEKIDRLFACNAGEYVDLPQLVVVGDQSSGKSSVLVALTDLPFPRDS